MPSLELDAAIAELTPADRRVFLAILHPIELLSDQLEQITTALALLDRLDDQREAELRSLRVRVQALELLVRGEDDEAGDGERRPSRAVFFPEAIRVQKAADGELIEAPPTPPANVGDWCVRAGCGDWIPAGEVHRSMGRPFHLICYQAEVRDLRRERAEVEGGGEGA